MHDLMILFLNRAMNNNQIKHKENIKNNDFIDNAMFMNNLL